MSSATKIQQRMLMEAECAQIGKLLHEAIPKGNRFILLIFDEQPGGNLAYLSSAQREDAVRVLREFLARQEAELAIGRAVGPSRGDA